MYNIQVCPKKKESIAPLLAEDFNYQYTKLLNSREAPRVTRLNCQKKKFKCEHILFLVILIFIVKRIIYHKYTLTYQKYKKKESFFKYGLAKLYLIFPIVRIFQITRKLMHNDVFVHAPS
jgi:hypothetical protein